MNTSNLAFLDAHADFYVREDPSDYDTDARNRKAAASRAERLEDVQGLLGDALNLAGLLLASLEDEGDARAMQIYTAVRVIEDRLEAACRQIDLYELRRVGLSD